MKKIVLDYVEGNRSNGYNSYRLMLILICIYSEEQRLSICATIHFQDTRFVLFGGIATRVSPSRAATVVEAIYIKTKQSKY